MSMAPQELENNASKYASEAIKFDSQGARGMAIANYQKAIDSLVKLLQLYPSSKLNPIIFSDIVVPEVFPNTLIPKIPLPIGPDPVMSVPM